MSQQPAPYILKPKRRRYWPWILLTLLIVLFVWWIYPRHYRIRDIAAELDRTKPGWRYDELQLAKRSPPEEGNAIVFLNSLEDQLPGSLNAAQSLILKQAGDWQKAKKEDENVLPDTTSDPEEFTDLVEKTFKLRLQLPQLLKYSTAHYQKQRWDDLMLKGIPPRRPRLAEWWTLLIVDLGESLRYQNQAAIELRTRLLFHHLVLHQLPCREDSPQFARDFLFASGQLERVLAQTRLSDATLAEIDRLLVQLNWIEIERKGLVSQRANTYEMTRIHLDRLQEALELTKNRSSIPWYTKTYLLLAKDDWIEGGTLTMEYLQLRLEQLNDIAKNNDAIAQLVEKVKRFRPGQNDSQIMRSIKEFRDGGKASASYQIQSFEQDRATLRHALAMQQILHAAIAVERFRNKAGSWPKALTALVPGYMASVPDDPFHPGKSLLLVPDSKGISIKGSKHSDESGLPIEMQFRLPNRPGTSAK